MSSGIRSAISVGDQPRVMPTSTDRMRSSTIPIARMKMDALIIASLSNVRDCMVLVGIKDVTLELRAAGLSLGDNSGRTSVTLPADVSSKVGSRGTSAAVSIVEYLLEGSVVGCRLLNDGAVENAALFGGNAKRQTMDSFTMAIRCDVLDRKVVIVSGDI